MDGFNPRRSDHSREKIKELLMFNFRYIDVGARDLFFPFWKGSLSDIKCIAFEPEITAHESLLTRIRHLGFHPDSELFSAALGGSENECLLYVTRQPGCSSIYKPISFYGELFNRPDNFIVDSVQNIKLQRADSLIGSSDEAPILLKLDIEGAELDALSGFGEIMSSVWCLQVEVNFLPYREGQASPEEILAFCKQHNLLLVEEIDAGEYCYNGKNKFSPINDRILNFFSEDIPYTKGIKCSADWLFIRDFQSVPEDQMTLYIDFCCRMKLFDLADKLGREYLSQEDYQVAHSAIRKSSRIQFLKYLALASSHRILVILKKLFRSARI